MTITHPPIPGSALQDGVATQLPADVREEKGKLAQAELLIVQFPLWWCGPPAILKGWFDRVLTSRFAYGDRDPQLG